MQKVVAASLAGSLVLAAQLVGGHYSPTPSHPKTAAWYAALRKPRFTPPGPVFGLAWTGLDALFGYSGYRLLVAPPSARRTTALAVWATNLLGIAGFSFVLFGRKNLGGALGVTSGMVASSAAAVATSAMVDRKAALADAPLLAWVLFATVLQEEVWRKNT